MIFGIKIYRKMAKTLTFYLVYAETDVIFRR
jgi:hypothetical protein